jgi:hypothetical protein
MVPHQPTVSCYTGHHLCLFSFFPSVWAPIHHDDSIIYYDLDYLDAKVGKRLTATLMFV